MPWHYQEYSKAFLLAGKKVAGKPKYRRQYISEKYSPVAEEEMQQLYKE